jgi:hypothetical protein
MKYLWIAAAAFTLAFALWGTAIHLSYRDAHPKHEGEFNWAIQGETGHANCDTQPGTHRWYIENEGQQWFMGCRREQPIQVWSRHPRKQPATIGPFTILPGNDPNAPPPTATFKELIAQQPESTSEWKRFDNLHAAAIYAALRLEDCSHVYECSGYIAVDPKGKFVVSPVRTDYNSDNVRVEDDEGPSDWKVVADFHSHPCVPHHYTGLFSGEDMIGALMGRKTAYMVDLCTGDVHEFIPGKDRVDVEPIHDGDEYLSPGRIIGHVPAYPNDPTAHEGL